MLLPFLAALVGTAVAMPRPAFNDTELCQGGRCNKPPMKFERISAAQPGFQWDDAGGYCGSWAIQRATLAKGAYISQQQVRDHTSAGGGNDNEILSTNIEEAFRNLKIDSEGFDYTNTPAPQQPAYFKWLKEQLVTGHTVTWMIMWSGQSYPIYGLTPPAGLYGHVEPVVGIQSNHPLTDAEVYEDDVVVHYTDAGVNAVYKTIVTLPGTWGGVGERADCGAGNRYCIGPYSFGWAIKGFVDDKEGAPASLHIDPWKEEPDLRAGAKAIPIQGTLTASDLIIGSAYDIFRWDTVGAAFTYSSGYKKASFTATADVFVYKDPVPFLSNSTTYYRVVYQ